MAPQRITFPGHDGNELAARLDMPDGPHLATALFAHCFTCGKDIPAARRIAARLAGMGIAVLRFDFTGLGHSRGEFANTSFTSNVGDLIAASRYLEERGMAPALLIGHSLGGAAVLKAAPQLPQVRAVATIGAPFDPGHVTHNFADALPRIMAEGVAEVSLGGRPFRIGRAFVEDVADAALAPAIAWVETPSNPWLRIVDIAAAADAAHAVGARLVVDSTAASPVLSQPLSLGADIVMHSATKGINGHSDVLSGALCVAEADSAIWQMIREDRDTAGAVMAPMEAWLLTRGMRTLPLRMREMSRNAMALAEFLSDHPQVEEVMYPGLPGHMGHALAARQMQGGFGGLLSFVVKGGAEAALRAAGRLQLFHRATSLGGVESLVEHRHTIEPHTGIPEGLLRLSVGIEDAGDLRDDLAQALGQ